MSRVFADHAYEYAEAGLVTFPVDDHKTPLVKNFLRFGPNSCERYIAKFPSANIGIVNRRWRGIGVTVVDIDDENLVDYAKDRFGETPLQSTTPGGGSHLWYRANGEKRRCGLEGRRIDICGEGGFFLAPLA